MICGDANTLWCFNCRSCQPAGTGTTRQEIHQQLDAFLLDRRKSDGGYAKITQKDITDLGELLRKIIEEKCEPDPEGNRPIEFKLIDRTRFEPMHFVPVAYEHKAENQGDLDEILDDHLLNLSIAMNRVETELQVTRLRKR